MAQSVAHSVYLGGPADEGLSSLTRDFADLSLTDTECLPCLVLILGSPDSGKTTLGQALAADYPNKFSHASFGDQMRRTGRVLESKDFVVQALKAESGHQFVTIAGNFTPQFVLRLYEALPRVILLQILAGSLEDIQQRMRKRCRTDGDLDRRIDAWRRRSGSPEMDHVMHVVGGRHISSSLSVDQVTACSSSHCVHHRKEALVPGDLLAVVVHQTALHSLVHCIPYSIPLSSCWWRGERGWVRLDCR